MPDRSRTRRKRRRPADLNRLAKTIVDEATGGAPPAPEGNEDTAQDDGKNPAAVALGKLGGKKGGPARAKKLSAKQRSAIARKAARARWRSKKKSD